VGQLQFNRASGDDGGTVSIATSIFSGDKAQDRGLGTAVSSTGEDTLDIDEEPVISQNGLPILMGD
jgi:hypothetical protein